MQRRRRALQTTSSRPIARSAGSRLSVAATGGVTRRRQVYEDGSAARALSRTPRRRALEAVIVNTAGGIAGGDRHRPRHRRSSDGAALAVTTAAAEKVYRALGPRRRDRRQARRSARARGCRWLPQETILFDRARLNAPHRGRSCAGRARCCWPRPSCSAAPAWARRWSRARSPTAGASAATAGWSLPRPCGSTARSRAMLARAGGGRRRRRDRDRAGRAGRRRRWSSACARANFLWRGRRLGLERACGGAALRQGWREPAARSRRGDRRRWAARCRGSG